MMQQLIMDSFFPDEETTQIKSMEELINLLDEGIFITTYINDIQIFYDEYKILNDVIVFARKDKILAQLKIDNIHSITVNKITSIEATNEEQDW